MRNNKLINLIRRLMTLKRIYLVKDHCESGLILNQLLTMKAVHLRFNHAELSLLLLQVLSRVIDLRVKLIDLLFFISGKFK